MALGTYLQATKLYGFDATIYCAIQWNMKHYLSWLLQEPKVRMQGLR